MQTLIYQLETQNWRVELIDLATPGESPVFMSMTLGLAHPVAARQVVAQLRD